MTLHIELEQNAMRARLEFENKFIAFVTEIFEFLG